MINITITPIEKYVHVKLQVNAIKVDMGLLDSVEALDLALAFEQAVLEIVTAVDNRGIL